jgi:O-palmitoleoyl-L-serine hydrolase
MVPYCDGALHQGHAEEPIRYKDATLYFRGAKITRSLFDQLNVQFGLFNSTKVVLTGASAGGLATFIWSNYLKTKLKNPGYLYSIPDTGVFLN